MDSHLTPQQAAHLLNISRRRIYQMVQAGELIATQYRKGRKISIPMDAVQRFTTPSPT
jgi:excisionase family DNA binding protein